MDHRLGYWIAVLAVGMLAGCTGQTGEYRTYSESDDEVPAVVDSGEAAPAGMTADLAQAGAAQSQASPGQTPPANAATANLPAVQGAPATTETAAPPALDPETRPPGIPEPVRIAMLDASDPGASGAGTSETAAVTGPLEIKLLIPEKDFPRVDAGKSLRVSYDDIDLLKVLNMEPVPADCDTHFPEWLKSLDGSQVRIRGFMVPPPRETGLPGFTLARDNQICCFGREPKVYDVIPVFLKEGTTTNYIPNRPFDVVGRFFIRPDIYRGELQNLYEIEDAEVITN